MSPRDPTWFALPWEYYIDHYYDEEGDTIVLSDDELGNEEGEREGVEESKEGEEVQVDRQVEEEKQDFPLGSKHNPIDLTDD